MPAKDVPSAELLKTLKGWCDRQGVTYYDQGRGGIEHTVLIEEGWVVPGSVIVGADSHSCTYGALGSFGTGLGATDIAGAMALGSFWQIVPGTIEVEFAGAKGAFVTGKDLILALIAEIGVAGATGMALEFVGAGAAALSIDERMAVSNMAVEAGADTGLFPADEVTAVYLEGRTGRPWTAERSDGDAQVAARVRIDLDRLVPLIALPHSPGNVVPVADAVGRKIDQVYIGNCANGTMTDLRQAAEVLAGRSVHRDCRAIVVPASQKIYRQALAEGLLDTVRAGGVRGDDADLRRLSRRAQRRDRAPARAPSRPRTATSRAAWARARRSSISRTPGWPRLRPSRARSSTPPTSSVRSAA